VPKILGPEISTSFLALAQPMNLIWYVIVVKLVVMLQSRPSSNF